ncbi:hypothetical protein ACFL0L_02370 [Patescibacteria group bacterium]
MEFFRNIIDFFIDPQSIGFVILIGFGLWIIIFLMNKGTEVWKRDETQQRTADKKTQDSNLPFKPF